MDKDIGLIIAEMLIKQDETTEQIKELTSVVKEVNSAVKTLANGLDIVGSNVKIVASNGEKTNSILLEFMDNSARQWEQQQAFNEIFASELKEIKMAVVKVPEVDSRLKAIEECENKFESRLTNVERLLKAF